MASKFLLAFALIAVLTVSIQAAAVSKRETKERPEAPLLIECDEPGDKRENCFSFDSSNVEAWQEYLDEISAWEKAYPKDAEAFNSKNPNTNKEEKDKLAELKKFAAVHETD